MLTLFVVSIGIFLLARLSGDPTYLLISASATTEDIATLRESLGLDKPLYYQYAVFAKNALTGDLGVSLMTRQPVTTLILQRLPNSVTLATAATFMVLLIAVPLGVVAAVYKGTRIDTLAQVMAVLGQSLPSFAVGIILLQLFGVWLRILPVEGTGSLAHYLLPAFTLGWFVSAGVMRLLRSGLIDALASDYVRVARAKGLHPSHVVWHHALKNALIPVVTYMGMHFALFITLAIVVEVVFNWPGIGWLGYQGVATRDYPVVQAIVLLSAAISIFVNLAVDITYAYLDPRIRYGEAA